MATAQGNLHSVPGISQENWAFLSKLYSLSVIPDTEKESLGPSFFACSLQLIKAK